MRLTDWVSMGPSGLPWGELLRCPSTLLLVSVPLPTGHGR